MEGHPIVTVPRDLSFHGTGDRTVESESSTTTNDEESSSGYPVYLTEDWDSGIGGGLWTTGLALGRYFATSPQFLEEFRSLRDSKREKRQTQTATAKNGDPPSPVRVLELGSGNGFLAVCLVAAIAVAEANECPTKPSLESPSMAKALENWPGIEVVVTDTAEHLGLMKTTIESNLKRILSEVWTHHTGTAPESAPTDSAIEKIARVEEYLWGEDYDFGETTDEKTQEPQSFDLIIGSDVAYRDHLHDPLISALDEFCVPQHTVALIGVTMNDTKPIFFEKLHRRGYKYEKLADYLLGEDFCTSSRQFGVFCISKS